MQIVSEFQEFDLFFGRAQIIVGNQPHAENSEDEHTENNNNFDAQIHMQGFDHPLFSSPRGHRNIICLLRN